MPRLRGRKFTGLSLIEQQHVLALRATAFRLGKSKMFALLSLLMAGHLAGEHTALDGGADGDHLVYRFCSPFTQPLLKYCVPPMCRL